jgi:hypothetical protein
MSAISSDMTARCSGRARCAASDGEVLGPGALRGERGGAHLEDASCLVHLVEGEAVKGRQELQGRLAQPRRPFDDERARTPPRGHDPHGLQGAQPGAQRGAAHAHRLRQLALGGQPVPRPEATGLDLAPQVLHDLGTNAAVEFGRTNSCVASHCGKRIITV